MRVNKSNAKNHLKCIILKRGYIPILNCMGPVTNPRLLDEELVRLLIKLGLDVRVVEQNVEDAVKLNIKMLDDMVNNKPQPVKEEVKPVKEEVKPKNNKQNKNKK